MIRSILLWLFAVMLELLLICIFVNATWVSAQIEEERSFTLKRLGMDTTMQIVNASNDAYEYLFKKSGIAAGSYKLLIPSHEQRAASMGLESLGMGAFEWLKGRIDTFWISIYHSLQRLFTLLQWFPYLLPLLVPAIIDGLTQREIKKVSYGYASPVKYHTAFHLLVALIFVPLLYLFFPIAVTPLVVPVWAFVLAAVLLMLSANIQKQI